VNTKLDRIDPVNDALWDRSVQQFPNHSVFHRSAWARVLIETYGHRPFYFRYRAADGSGTLVPIMEVSSWLTGKRAVSLPFSDFGGILCADESSLDDVMAALSELALNQDWRYIQLRGGCNDRGWSERANRFVNATLDCEAGFDKVSNNFRPSVRRCIRKSMDSGVRVSISTSESDMGLFYELHCRTRCRHGVPPQSYRFFKSIHRHLMGAGMGNLVLARYRDKVIAGAVLLRSGCNAVYKFGASNDEFWFLRPNHLVISEMISFLCKTSVRRIDFGRTDVCDQGLRRFKRSWGAEEHSIPYSFLEGSPKRPLYSFGIHHTGERCRFKNASLARMIGRMIYPHLD
jgi:hypothetical protein